MVYRVLPCFPCADRTAAFLRAGAGVDDGFPYMVFGTDPPDFPVAADGDGRRGEVAVQGGVPLVSQGRVERCQVVEARQDFSARAVGAAAAAPRAVGDACLVAVSLGTAPPDPAVGVVRHLLGGQGPVFVGVPFRRQRRKACGQIVLPRLYFSSRTNGAARALVDAGYHAGLPAVPLGTTPPCFFVRAAEDLAGHRAAVFLSVPLGRQERVFRRQRVHLRQHDPVGADRAPRAPRPGADHGLVAVTFAAAPPNLFPAAVGHGFWGQGRVARRVPLGEQVFHVVCRAELEQALSYVLPPPFLSFSQIVPLLRLFSPVPTKKRPCFSLGPKQGGADQGDLWGACFPLRLQPAVIPRPVAELRPVWLCVPAFQQVCRTIWSCVQSATLCHRLETESTFCLKIFVYFFS